MTTDHVAALITSLAATYVVHSTLFLAAAWLLLARQRSHAWNCRGWRFAAVLGVVTAPLQLACGLSTFAVHLGDDAPTSPAAESAVEQFAATEHLRIEPSIVDVRPDDEPPIVVDLVAAAEAMPATPLAVPPDAPPFAMIAMPDDTENAIVATEAIVAPGPDMFDIETGTEFKRTAEAAVVPPPVPPAGPSSPVLPRVVAAFVLALFAAGLVRLVIAFARLRRWCGRGTPLRCSAARSALARLRRANGLRRDVALLELDDLVAPAACGVFRWRILLPRGLASRTSPAALEALLAHELAHLVRRDGLWLWIGHLLCGGLALQPLNFLARRRWRRASEFLCDAWAVRQGVRPTTLARCLTDLAAAASSPVPASVVAMSAIDSKSVLVERVERLLDDVPRPPSTWARLLFAAGCLGFVGAAPFVPAIVFEPARPSNEVVAIRSAASDVAAEARSADDDAASSEARDEWQRLDAELRSLTAELDRLQRHAGLFPELTTIAETLLRRREAIERHRRSLSERMR